MPIYSGFSHEKWWIFPLFFVCLPEGIPTFKKCLQTLMFFVPSCCHQKLARLRPGSKGVGTNPMVICHTLQTGNITINTLIVGKSTVNDHVQ